MQYQSRHQKYQNVSSNPIDIIKFVQISSSQLLDLRIHINWYTPKLNLTEIPIKSTDEENTLML